MWSHFLYFYYFIFLVKINSRNVVINSEGVDDGKYRSDLRDALANSKPNKKLLTGKNREFIEF